MKWFAILMLFPVLLLGGFRSQAQGGPVQSFNAIVDTNVPIVYFDLFDMRAGDTLYLYAESGDIDTYLIVCDIDCEEVLAENDDIDLDGGNTNSGLEYRFPEDGDYSIAVLDCCDEAASGEFFLLLGLNEPEVLTGAAEPAGEAFAEPFASTFIDANNPDGALTPQIVPLSTERKVQEFYALVTPDNAISYFDLFGMRAGQTIYLYAESTEIDPYVVICDIDCEENFAENDDIDTDAGNVNSALAYTFEEDGDYSIAVVDCCDEAAQGAFHLLIGFNAPEVLSGEAFPTGDQIAIPYEPTFIDVANAQGGQAGQVQQFYGAISADTSIVYYDIFGAEAGETIYLYVESNDFDTALVICDIDCEESFAENDDIDTEGGNLDSALEFTFPASGDYSIAILDCCDETKEGEFRLLIGYDAPQVLTGNAIPTGATIAVPYEPTRAAVAIAEEARVVDAASDCSTIELAERPILSGPMLTAETENFVIHYTLEGVDATTQAFVDEVVSFVELVLEVQTQELGWPAAPRDCGEGGDSRFDFYLMEILNEGILGYAQPENIVRDNPFSEFQETWAAYAYLAIDNDFAGVQSPLTVMRATISHEFHHAVQYGYDVGDPTPWVYEATASWMELQTSNDQDATGYARAVLEEPDLCVGSLNNSSGVRVYGEWLLIDSIARDFGPDSIIRMWEYLADFEGMDAYYRFLAELNTTPQEVMRNYAVRLLLMDNDFGGIINDRVRVESRIEGAGSYRPNLNGVEELGADYVLIRRRGNYTFNIDDSNLSLLVVGIDVRTQTVDVFDIGQSGTVDTTPYSNAYVIVLNNIQHMDPNNCQNTQWTLTVTEPTERDITRPLGIAFNIQNFEPAG